MHPNGVVIFCWRNLVGIFCWDLPTATLTREAFLGRLMPQPFLPQKVGDQPQPNTWLRRAK